MWYEVQVGERMFEERETRGEKTFDSLSGIAFPGNISHDCKAMKSIHILEPKAEKGTMD